MEHGDKVTIEPGWPADDGAGAPLQLTCGELAGHLQDDARADDLRLFALLDAAHGDLVLERLASVDAEDGEGEESGYEVLGPGRTDDELFTSSAFLVPCPEGSELLWWLCTEGLGQSYGVLLASEASPGELAAHLHPLTEVRDDLGRTLLFRFYDPRVLRTYLPTCTPWELRRFYGPVQHLWAEAAHGLALLDFPKPQTEGEEVEEDAGDPLAGQTLMMEERPDLVIRQAQLEAFAAAAEQGFERRLVKLLRQQFPDDCVDLGDDGVTEVVELGIQRAAAHGLQVEGDVCLFVAMMFLFGPEFDEDPALPWAARVLGDARLETSGERIDALWAEAERQLEAMAGGAGQGGGA